MDKKTRKQKHDKNNRSSNNSSNPRNMEDEGVLNASVAAERKRIQHRIKDSTPNQIVNNSDDVEPPKITTRKKIKKVKKVKKKIVKSSNIDEDINSNSVGSQNKDFIDDLTKDAPPLAIPYNVKDKLKEEHFKKIEQAARKTSTKSKNSINSQQAVEINSTNATKKIKKKKRPRRSLKKKIEKSEEIPESNNNVNLNNSPKRTIHRIILRGGISNKEQINKSESSEEEESISSSKKIKAKAKAQNHVSIRPSSSASSTKSLTQKHKDTSSKGKNYSDTSNNSNTIKKSSSSTSSKKIQMIKEDYDETIDSTIDEEEDFNNNYKNEPPKIKNDEISNHIKKHLIDLNNQQPSQNEEEKSEEYDKNSNYENEEEEEEEDDIELQFEKEKSNNKNGSGNSGNNKPKFDHNSDYYSNSDDIRKEILSPIRGNEHRSLSDGTFKDINHDTLSISGIIGSIGSQSDDYSYNSSSSKKHGIKKKVRNEDFKIIGNKNNKDDNIIRNKKEFNRRNSDPTLDFIEFNDAANDNKRKVNFDNYNEQNNKRAKLFNVNFNIDLNRNPNRHQSVRIQKTNQQINNNTNNMNFIRNSKSNGINNGINNDINLLAFPKFNPKPINFHLQNYSNAKFPINDDEFHDFELTCKKKIDLSPPINFQIKIIPNPPIIAIDAELEAYNREKLLKEIKRQQ